MARFRKGGYDGVLDAWFGALKLALFATAVLALSRPWLLWWFSSRLAPETGWREIGAALTRGLGYDMLVGFYAALLPLTFGLANLFVDARRESRAVARMTGAVYCYLTAFALVASVQYIKEYGDHFNHFLFGLVYDDREAIAKMIWKEYNPVPGLIATGLLGYLLDRFCRRFTKVRIEGRTQEWPRQWKVSATLALFAVFMVMARGGLGVYPIQLRDRDVTRDVFLNRMVLNPWLALKYAVKHHSEAEGGRQFKNPPTPADAAAACGRVAPGGACATVSDTLTRAVPPAPTPRARHVFLVIIESYDSWPYLDKYAELRLVEEGKKLASEGLLVRAFLPAETGTMTTLSPLISGLYNPGIRANYQPSSRTPFEAAPAAIFASQGYATRFFSGGSLSWQQLGDFLRNQGFAEVYGMESIKEAKNVNEWGVDDGSLFSFVLSKLDDSKPSFNVILTTGNHPTYSMDLASVGWAERGTPESLKGAIDGSLPEVILGHLWYSDQTASRFAREAAKKLPGALVALTGDHFSRKFVNQRPTAYESTSVPLILYGPSVLDAKRKALEEAGTQLKGDDIAGSHLDLLPTFYNLAFAPGTKYAAVGSDLLDPARSQVGLGRNAFVTPAHVIRVEEGSEPEKLPWANGEWKPEAVEKTRKRLYDLQLLSWWRIMKGNKIR